MRFKEGDKVKIPKTKLLGHDNVKTSFVRKRSISQGFMFVIRMCDKGEAKCFGVPDFIQCYVLNDVLTKDLNTGDFFCEDELELYNPLENFASLIINTIKDNETRKNSH